MASLRVKPLGGIRDCGFFGLRGGGCRRRMDGFVSYSRGGGTAVNGSRLIVVNRADWDCGAPSSSSSSSSSLIHGRRDRDQGYSSSSSNSYKLESLAEELRRSYDRERRDESVDVDIASKLDLWVKESVGEIMSNIEEAPFLVHVYSDSEDDSDFTSSGKTRFVREKASAESWPVIKGRWGGENPTPNGIILVEEMKNDEEENGGEDSSFSSTKVWGILIQGKGLSVPACYILKTCRIRSVLGCCTHFCLVRVECFLESVDVQLKKLWLV